MTPEETNFDKFWQSSSLDKFNIQQFAQQITTYDSDSKEMSLAYPLASKPLPSVRSRINKISKNRRSERTYSGKKMSVKELGQILSSFNAWNGLEHRGYPSAGATYVVEIFCTAFNVESFSGKTIYYDPENHGTVIVSEESPSWEEASKTLNIETAGRPNLLITMVLFPERAISKYGERGGRFALLEAGAAMQQLSLQIAESSSFKGTAVGGMLDDVWLRLLKLDKTNAHIALGYLVGK